MNCLLALLVKAWLKDPLRHGLRAQVAEVRYPQHCAVLYKGQQHSAKEINNER
jgi:hypothetical protein